MEHGKRTKKGSILAYVLIMMTIVSIILVSMLQYISAQARLSTYKARQTEAFQVAEAGVYFYRWYLAHQIAGKTATQIMDFWQSGSPLGVDSPYQGTFSDPEGGAIGTYEITAQAPEVGSTIVIVQSTGWVNSLPNSKKTIQVRFRRPSWSENIVLANDDMRFGAGTVVNGRIHSNAGIRFDGIASNIVSSSLDQYNDPDHTGNDEFGVHTHVNPPPGSGVNNSFRTNEAPPEDVDLRSDVFQAGRQFPVPSIDFEGVRSDLSFMKTQALNDGVYFDNTRYGRRIILKTDNTFDVCTVNSFDISTSGIIDYSGVVSGATGSYSGTNGNSCLSSQCCVYGSCGWISSSRHSRGKCVTKTNSAMPDNGVIFVEDNAWVEGTINDNRLSIVAADLIGGSKPTMFIGMDNILYTNFDGQDIIGLIGQQDVEVVRNSLNILTIDAALLAQSGRVGAKHYMNYKDTITINGSMATNQRYGFAWTDGTGYDNRILNFDNNLLYYPPPFFPTGTEYFIDLWEEL